MAFKGIFDGINWNEFCKIELKKDSLDTFTKYNCMSSVPDGDSSSDSETQSDAMMDTDLIYDLQSIENKAFSTLETDMNAKENELEQNLGDKTLFRS